MRIALDGRTIVDRFPGIGRHVYGLARALPEVASDDRLFLLVSTSPSYRLDVSTLSGFAHLGAPPLRAGLPGPPRHLARTTGWDVFHATHLAAAARLPCPTVVTLYDLIPLTNPDSMPALTRRTIYRLLLRRAVRSATCILTLTEASKREIVDRLGVRSERISVSSAAAGPHLTPQPPDRVEAIRRQYDLPPRYVLYVGTPRPHKNHPRLLAAWRGLTAELPEVALVLVGGEDGRRLSQGDESGGSGTRLRRLGAVPESDLAALYSGAELYVQPSLAEGFGLPVLEAMACGTAVCCSRIPALTEVAGGAADHFDPHDPDDIAGRILELMNSPSRREALTRRGRERAAGFRWQDVAEHTMSVYREAAARRRLHR